MATKTQIQKALTLAYDRVLFAKDVLRPVFGSAFTLLDTPSKTNIALTKSESRVINKVGIYAHSELDDATNITFYEVTLQPQVRIEQSKVAIQQFVRKLLIPGQAALINFISPRDQDTWRFTLVAKDSKISSKGIEEIQTHPQRYTYLVEKSHSNRTMAERLEGLSILPSMTLETLISAFSVESMSEDFFREYKEQYQSFVQYLTGKRMVKEKGKWTEKVVNNPSPFLASFFNGNEKNARDFIKKLMGRIIFLYFVQKKRWLGASTKEYQDGPVDFISRLFSETGGNKQFFPLGLSELFFNALNTQRANDDWKMPSGRMVKVPYLNGGLFIRDEIDEVIHKRGDLLTFPPHLFSDVDKEEIPNRRGFLDFLNAFNFTVYEDSQYEHTVAVDPEMLGHIFENLLEDNQDKGAFYTPKEIVHYMCQESLIEYLTTHLSKEYKVYRKIGNNQFEVFGNEASIGQLAMVETLGEKALDRNDVENIVKEKNIQNLSDAQLNKIDGLLSTVKICDPAIGSGAFPMGLLQEIFTIKEAISSWFDIAFEPARVKENIIQTSIYGVDIEKGAVDIARLRFWLSLVVDEELPKALPNLDYKIVVGDSLVSRFENIIIEVDWDRKLSEGKADQHLQALRSGIQRIVEKQKQYFDPDVRGKHKLKLDIRTLKIDVLQQQLLFNKEIYLATSPIKGGFAPSSAELRHNLDRELAVSEFDKSIKMLNGIKNQPEKKFTHFDWKLDFPEVLNPLVAGENSGFDIVIANPPYLKERGNAHIFKPVNESAFGEKWHQGKMDYWFYFLHKAMDITKEDSNIAFITSRYWLNSQGAKKLIVRVSKNLSFVNVVDIGKLKVFDKVAGHHMIAIYQKAKKEKFVYKQLKEDVKAISSKGESENLKISELNNSDVFQSGGEVVLAKPILFTQEVKPLGKLYDVSQGVVEASDKVSAKQYKKAPLPNIKVGQGIFVLTDDEYRTMDLTEKERELIRNYLDPYDVDRYSINVENPKYLIYTDSSSKNLVNSDQSYSHIKAHLDLLKKYITSSNAPYGLHRARDPRFFNQPKILFKNMFVQPSFAYDEEKYYCGFSFASIIQKAEKKSLKYLLALLNSSFARSWFYINGKQRGAGVDIGVEKLRGFPVPNRANVDQFDRMVDIVIKLKSISSFNTKDKLINAFFEQVIDGMVYELYFPNLLEKHNRNVLKHLGHLPELNDNMSDNHVMTICRDLFTRLNEKSHPIRNNLFYLNSIPEIAKIEGKHENN